MHIAFIGFGSAAFDIGSELVKQGITLSFYKHRDKPPFSGLLAKRVQETNAVYKPGYQELLEDAHIILSCVVGRAALDVARESLPFLTPDHLFADLNTTPPKIKKEAERLVQATGALYVDAAIMGPVEVLKHKTPILASGDGARQFRDFFAPYGMDITVLDGGAGKASAVKLLRSVFQKGLMAVLLEMLLAARAYGVQDLVLDSVSKTMDGVPLRTTAGRLIAKGVVNAGRMAAEMEDVLHALQDMGLNHAMTQGALDTYTWCEQLGIASHAGDIPPKTLDDALEMIGELTAGRPAGAYFVQAGQTSGARR